MRIAKVAQGFLELLRARPDGISPPTALETVQPTLDMTDFYGADLLLGSAGAPTVGALLNLTEAVTLTRVARIHSAGGILTVGAAPVTGGGFIEVGIVSPNGQQCPVGTFSFGVAAAGQIVGFGVPLRMVLPAGFLWYARCGGTAAGADHSLSSPALIENYTLT